MNRSKSDKPICRHTANVRIDLKIFVRCVVTTTGILYRYLGQVQRLNTRTVYTQCNSAAGATDRRGMAVYWVDDVTLVGCAEDESIRLVRKTLLKSGRVERAIISIMSTQ